MKISIFALTAAVLLALAAAPASAADRGYALNCGDQNPPSEKSPYRDLMADNVSCSGARKVADKYSSGKFSDGYKGWTCRAKVLSPEDLKVKCDRSRNGGQRVKFLVGS